MRHILVVEDNPQYGAWLCSTVAALPHTRATLAESLAAGRACLTAPPPGLYLALIDLGLPDGSGVELVRALADGHAGVMPVVTTIFDDDAHVFAALAAGAQGYLLKDAPPEELLEHLARIERGIPPISPAIARRMLAHFRAAASPPQAGPVEPLCRLTSRETDVLRYIGRGLRVPEAARLLSVTEHTAAGYVKTLYRKLNISSRAEAALEAARRGLV